MSTTPAIGLEVPDGVVPSDTFAHEAVAAARRLGACVAAGAMTGLLVGGVGGRLAMALLARTSPAANGLTSDDGFEIGTFTLAGTLNLLALGVLLGAAGGGFYALLRGLCLGHRWFDIAALAVGPGVVVGSVLVHTDGVDFRVLRPAWLAIALFVAIPALYGGMIAVVAERWLASEAVRSRLPAAVAIAPVLMILPLVPFAALLVAVWLVHYALRQTEGGRSALAHPVAAFVGRTALAVVFVVSGVALVRDILVLT